MTREDLIAPGPEAAALRSAGFICIVEFLAQHRPHLLQWMDETPDATLRDGYKLSYLYCRIYRSKPPKIQAPGLLREQGIERVNVYPIDLLEERFPLYNS